MGLFRLVSWLSGVCLMSLQREWNVCLMPPKVWTDGGLVVNKVEFSSDSVCFAHLPGIRWLSRGFFIWMTLGMMVGEWRGGRVRLGGDSALLPGPFQTVRRTQFCVCSCPASECGHPSGC